MKALLTWVGASSKSPILRQLSKLRDDQKFDTYHSVHFHVNPKLLRWCENQSKNRC